MFDFFGETQPQNSMAKGRQALIYFHNQALKYPNYGLTIDTLIQSLGKTEALRSRWLEGIGDAIVQLELSMGDVKKAMENLADEGQGEIPAQATTYADALINKSHDFSFTRSTGHLVDAVSEATADFATDLATVGEGVRDSILSVSAILPILVVGAVVFIVVMKSKRIAG